MRGLSRGRHEIRENRPRVDPLPLLLVSHERGVQTDSSRDDAQLRAGRSNFSFFFFFLFSFYDARVVNATAGELSDPLKVANRLGFSRRARVINSPCTGASRAFRRALRGSSCLRYLSHRDHLSRSHFGDNPMIKLAYN